MSDAATEEFLLEQQPHVRPNATVVPAVPTLAPEDNMCDLRNERACTGDATNDLTRLLHHTTRDAIDDATCKTNNAIASQDDGSAVATMEDDDEDLYVSLDPNFLSQTPLSFPSTASKKSSHNTTPLP